ncbi:MAG TPA: hypothetical protein ENN19_14045 [Chloroflexi bacterium]|nr:hypothetical protein [Chloroflexota bacterium]
MQMDFHYYCIAVLARAAGFNKEDALVIAYASQYTDDATESELIHLDTDDGNLRFDPVRTAYEGLDLLGALNWSAQKRVYIPFHFLPPRHFAPENSDTFSFVTRPAVGALSGDQRSLGEMLLEQAASEALCNNRRRLCRIGIALHTIADTWAHQQFSGRWNRTENDVEEIYVYDREAGEYRHLVPENVILDALPQIGHAEAGYFPDLAYQHWKCDLKQSPAFVERDNVKVFLEAAQAIYDLLCPLEKMAPDEPIPWTDIAPSLWALFSAGPAKEASVIDRMTIQTYRHYHMQDIAARCGRWQAEFDHLFRPYPVGDRYAYERHRWRDKALEGDTRWDDWSQREWDRMSPLGLEANFWDSLWVHFHRAALRQRHFVLERLP